MPLQDTKSQLTRLTQQDAHLVVTKHEILLTGRLGGARANFSFCDLTGVDLSNRNLADAIFTGALLAEANLSHAKMDACNL
ncbi:MAG TPA: hypothetical protein DCL48_08545, partial [Alphaproteobacteria bacterium]|nr:hypothetical protein [Alphaproteobacteria bacterium]